MADLLKIVLDDATEGRGGALLLSRFGNNLIGFRMFPMTIARANEVIE